MNRYADLARRLDNLLLPGTITEVDTARALCRVQAGELITAWLPWFVRRAGATRDWDPPTLGEQCLVLSPGGEPTVGFVLTGIYSQDNPAPSDRPTLMRREFPDGAAIEYDHEAHALNAYLPAGGTVLLESPGGVTVVGDIDITGRVTVSDDVVAAGISLVNHTHGGVQPGSGSTGAAQ